MQMNGLSVVIPSRNIKNLNACIAAIRACGESLRTIIVDDGLEWPKPPGEVVIDKATEILAGEKPFVFARNMNIGIRAAGEDDVILLNDDAELRTYMGFSEMQRAWRENSDGNVYGVVSAATNLAGNPQQQWNKTNAKAGIRPVSLIQGHTAPVVAFVCVFIPRLVLDTTGLLDERYVEYGWDDNDYCRRAYLQNFQTGVYDGCFVDHSKLTSTYRGGPARAGNIEPGRKIYMGKWGSL